MSLKDKAFPTLICKQLCNHACKLCLLPDEVISLADAQKEISTLVAKVLEGIKLIDEWKQLNDDYHAELTKAEAKIEAAKQIVEDEELWNHHEPEVRQLLRNALLIPRKEEKNGFVKLAGLMKKENTSP